MTQKENLQSVKVLAPATIANLVCGFDVLGLALNDPQDIMEISFSSEPGIRIKHVDNYKLSTIPEENVAGASLLALMHELDGRIGFNVTIDKRIKPGSGLGSSAASAAGIVVAANHLLGGADFLRKILFVLQCRGKNLHLALNMLTTCRRVYMVG